MPQTINSEDKRVKKEGFFRTILKSIKGMLLKGTYSY